MYVYITVNKVYQYVDICGRPKHSLSINNSTTKEKHTRRSHNLHHTNPFRSIRHPFVATLICSSIPASQSAEIPRFNVDNTADDVVASIFSQLRAKE